MEGYEAFACTGRPTAGHAGMHSDDFWNFYQRGMRNLAGVAALEVKARFPMPPAARDMLDILGSHGFFSVSLCRKHPHLKSVIPDVPAAPILSEEKMGVRVTRRPGWRYFFIVPAVFSIAALLCLAAAAWLSGGQG